MAYTVSQNFKTKIKDETVPKSCLILFNDLFFSTTDITEGGATFSQYFNTSEDLTFGDCPSDTLSFAVVANGTLSGYGFGKCRTYLGVQTAVAEYAFGDINAHIEVGGNTYTASSSGLYRNDVKISSAVYVSLVSDGTYVYAIGTNYSARVINASGSISAYTPNRFMAWKLRNGLSAVFSENTAHVWDGENVITYEYVPMGVYNVARPRSTAGDVVTVQDAYDNMSLFDRDAAEFLENLTYPCTLSEIYTVLCTYAGVSFASSTFPYSTVSYSASPFSDTGCSLRDILWWIAERARRVAHFDRTGVLELRSINSTVRETLTASMIGQDGYSVAEYATQAVTGVLLRSSSGNSLRFGGLDTAYVISANPFISTITVSDLQGYMAIPTYVPMELTVLEADPSIDVGDFVNIKPMVEEYKVLTNVYREIYVNANNEAYAVGSPTYAIPIMNRSVHFNSGIRATYTATGNENREADLDNTEYNADVAANMAVGKSKAYADQVTQEVDESFTQQKVFNRLTDNGRAQGMFMDTNGDIYFNATYINSGYISADRIKVNSLSVEKLTGRVSNGDWGINFTTGTMSIGSLAVSKITGSKSLGNNWGINFDTGEMTIGDLSADHITSGEIDADTITIKNINGANIKAGTITIGGLDSEAQGALVTEVTTKTRYYLSTSSASATGGTWSDTVPTWSPNHYVWTKISTTKKFANNVTRTTDSDAVYDSNLTTALSTASTAASDASSAQSTANGGVVSTVSVYYRSTTNTTPTINDQTSIGTAFNSDNVWSYVLLNPKKNTYFYTCEKYTKADGTVSFSTVRQMSNLTASSLWCSANNQTYIDGASIYARSVTADKISVNNLQAISSEIGGWNIDDTQINKTATINGNTYKVMLNAPASPTASNGAFVIQRTVNGVTDYPTRITYDGILHCKEADISGNITADTLTLATGLTIAGKHIGSGISGSNITTGEIPSSVIAADSISSSTLTTALGRLSSAKINNYLGVTGALDLSGGTTNPNPPYISIKNTSGTLTNLYPKWTAISITSSTTWTNLRNALIGAQLLIGFTSA